MTNAHRIKQDICEIGRRIYNKGFAAANDGNITVRISDNEVLCTPTMHSKGFLKPDDIATIDMQGNQTAGRKKRSSEARCTWRSTSSVPTSRALSTAIRPMPPRLP